MPIISCFVSEKSKNRGRFLNRFQVDILFASCEFATFKAWRILQFWNFLRPVLKSILVYTYVYVW
jgi:hypothetical protein